MKQTKVVKLTGEDKALQLFQAGAVSKVKDELYHVKSHKDANGRIRSNSVNECLHLYRL